MPTTSPLHQQARQKLLSRQSELRARFGAAFAPDADHPPEVHDFKDVASQESLLAVDEVTEAHAAQELSRIAAALRSIDAGSYGICHDCGEPIAEGRLLALPSAALCAGCQRARETGAPAAG